LLFFLVALTLDKQAGMKPTPSLIVSGQVSKYAFEIIDTPAFNGAEQSSYLNQVQVSRIKALVSSRSIESMLLLLLLISDPFFSILYCPMIPLW
jgi:hypothetical protein